MVGLEYFELLVDKYFGDLVNVRFVLFGMVGALGVARSSADFARAAAGWRA